MLECLAIKPDLIFLWDEAWFGFARFSPFLRRRTGDGRGGEAARRCATRSTASATKFKRSRRARSRNPSCSTCAAARSGQGAHPRLRDRLGAQVDVGAAPGLDHRGRRPGLPHRRGGVQGGVLHPHLDLAQPADHRLARRRAAADGARGLRAGAARDPARDRDPPRDQQPSADLEVLPGRHAGRDDPGRVPQVRASPTTAQPGWTLADADGALRRGRVLPRPDAHHAAVRQRRLRRHAVQGAARRASTTSRSTRPRATACWCRSTSTTRAATWRT